MREIFHVREKSRKQKNHMEDRRDEGKQESSERVKSAGKWESASILTQLNGAVRQRDHAGLAPNQKKKWCTMTGKSGCRRMSFCALVSASYVFLSHYFLSFPYIFFLFCCSLCFLLGVDTRKAQVIRGIFHAFLFATQILSK